MIGRASRAQMGARRRSAASGGVAPTITVAPVLTWTVAHGSSPTITEGTYTGDAGTWTYDLVRLPSITVLSGVSKATVEAYVADRATDLGPDWKVTGTITNGSGSDSADSNIVTWDRSALPIAGGYSGAGLTLADSGTTVDSWASSFGSISATLTAPTASRRPAYSASGGIGGRPLIDFDGSSDGIRGAISKGSAFTSVEFGHVATAGTVTNGDYAMEWGGTSDRQVQLSGGNLRANILGSLNRDGSTAISTSTPQHWSCNGTGSGGACDLRLEGSSESGGVTVNASIADGSSLGIGMRAGSDTGFYDGAIHAWYAGSELTTDQRLDLRALLTYLTGAAS